jgi:hypothetical protein
VVAANARIWPAAFGPTLEVGTGGAPAGPTP